MAAIAWDQTLVSALLSALAAWLAYRGAARVLHHAQQLRELRARRDALEQVLVQVEGPVREYLESGDDEEYPQREMVELERCALQAQVYFLRDLAMQKALRDVCYPNHHREALQTIRRGIEGVESEIAAGRRADS